MPNEDTPHKLAISTLFASYIWANHLLQVEFATLASITPALIIISLPLSGK
jgi:hypothetical protein